MSTFLKIVRIGWDAVARRGMVPPVAAIQQRVRKLKWTNPELDNRALRLLRIAGTTHLLRARGVDPYPQAELFRAVCEKSEIRYKGETFLYSPDFDCLICQPSRNELRAFGNLPVDFERLLRLGLCGIRAEILDARSQYTHDEVAERTLNAFESVCDSLQLYGERCLRVVDQFVRASDPLNPELRNVTQVLESALLEGATGFREALQTILIGNSLLWTLGMDLVGLGRLDKVLFSYYRTDIEGGRISDKEALRLIKEFLRLLHRDFYSKSNALAGDTGQVICLGGRDADGQDTANRLTYLFLQAAAELGQPDPKLVIRVHPNTAEELWDAIIECIMQRTGSPLLSNDDRVVPALEAAGYPSEDAVNYATSACWEPCIPTISADQNNLATIDFMAPLHELLNRVGSLPEDFSAFKQAYFSRLRSVVTGIAVKLNQLEFIANPLLSIMTGDCISRAKDASEGGAKYLNFGVTGVAFGNVINALLNIDRRVYREHRYMLREMSEMVERNFLGDELAFAALLTGGDKFCTSSETALRLSNEIIAVVADELKHAQNSRGRSIHFGVSSPSHIEYGSRSPASLDGRHSGSPYGVHISATAAGRSVPPTEAALFAAKLDYNGAFNGGVFDLIIDHMHVAEDRSRFRSFLRTAFSLGIFQFQANLIDLELLKRARRNPESCPQLIVRVWGFSAYFKDLPSEYQDILINRAEAACC